MHPSPTPARSGPPAPGAWAFNAAAEAWFWFMRCHRAQLDGAEAAVEGRERVCEPADIHRAVARLVRDRSLRAAHVRVLVRYGTAMLAPDPVRPGRGLDVTLWAEAMAHLDAALRAKGIVA